MTTYRIGAGLIGNGRHDFREAASRIEDRLVLLDSMADAARRTNCCVLELPAGFFSVKSQTEAEQLAFNLATRMARSKLLIAFGIDVESDEAKPASEKEMSNHEVPLPFFGCVLEDGHLLINCARQTGTRVDGVSAGQVAVAAGNRTMPSHLLGGRKVSLLLCGEVLSEAWRSHLHQARPALVLHPAHASVVLGGASKESWKSKVDDLLRGLPASSAWVFADHVRAMSHREEDSFVDMVRQGQGGTATWVSNTNVEGGRLYAYDVDLN